MSHTVIDDSRHDQIYPTLDDHDIERARRFGVVHQLASGEALATVGKVGPGLALVLNGTVDVYRHDALGERKFILGFGRGGLLGELSQLAGRPSLADAEARGPVEALFFEPTRMRALLIAEAELGERIMRALILRRAKLFQAGVGGAVIVGRADNPDVLRLEGFLDRNAYPHERLDPETEADARALIERFHVDRGQLPIVLCPNGYLLRNPGEPELARCVGLVGPIDPNRVFDVAIVGAGPAGLATAVYAASEGLSTLVLDCRSVGGQAGASSRIENYLGFPTGISGMALMSRAYSQATKFGVDLAIPDDVIGFDVPDDPVTGHYILRLASNERVTARSIVVACGVSYRRLAVQDIDQYEASSVHFWASRLEANLCTDQEVVLVGGGNSAGQAIVYLAQHARKVWVLVRGNDLQASMSQYLIDRIHALDNVEVVMRSQISGLEGANGRLAAVRWRIGTQEQRHAITHLFLFIGADPNTAWLAGSGVKLDTKGFVFTGTQAGENRRSLETSRAGVFAIGDVRSGSTKRVAAAVGEGAQVAAALHAYLATRAERKVTEHPEAAVAR